MQRDSLGGGGRKRVHDAGRSGRSWRSWGWGVGMSGVGWVTGVSRRGARGVGRRANGDKADPLAQQPAAAALRDFEENKFKGLGGSSLLRVNPIQG